MPSDLSTALDRAMESAGLLLSRRGPRGLPAACAARTGPTPQRRGFAKRVSPLFHCFQTMAPPKGGLLAPHVQLIEAAVLGLLFPDVFPDHGFVSTYRRDEVSPGPECWPVKLRFRSP
jgi:hypothetical protein